MIKLKKLGLATLGTLAITTPIATVVSCGEGGESSSTNSRLVTIMSNPKDGFSSAFKLSDTNTIDNDLISGGKIKSWTSLKHASFHPKTTLNITLSDAMKEKIKLQTKGDHKYWLVLHINSGDLIDHAFFQNDNNSKGDAQQIANKIQELEFNKKTKVAFKLELPDWLKTIKNIERFDMKVWGKQTSGVVGAPDFAAAQIESIESNGNKIESLELYSLGLSRFDPSKLPSNIKRLDIRGNKTAAFNQPYFISELISKLPSGLEEFILAGNRLTTLDPSKLPSGLKVFSIGNNALTTFDPSKLPSGIEDFDLHGNNLTTFDPSKLPSGITKLNLWGNDLTTLDLSKLPSKLKSLDLGYNKLTTFDLSKLPSSITRINLENNRLSTDLMIKIDAWNHSH